MTLSTQKRAWNRRRAQELSMADGCFTHPACLTCPLPACKFDEPGIERRLVGEAKRAEARALLAGGMAIPAVARVVGVSESTVRRIR